MRRFRGYRCTKWRASSGGAPSQFLIIARTLVVISSPSPPPPPSLTHRCPPFVSNALCLVRVQVPTLETPTGGIWESNAIARYVARLSDNGLLGSTPIETVRRAG